MRNDELSDVLELDDEALELLESSLTENDDEDEQRIKKEERVFLAKSVFAENFAKFIRSERKKDPESFVFEVGQNVMLDVIRKSRTVVQKEFFGWEALLPASAVVDTKTDQIIFLFEPVMAENYQAAKIPMLVTREELNAIRDNEDAQFLNQHINFWCKEIFAAEYSKMKDEIEAIEDNYEKQLRHRRMMENYKSRGLQVW